MDAYERLLGDAMNGDATLFAREDDVEEAWRIVDPVLAADTPVTVRAGNLGAGARSNALRRPAAGTTHSGRVTSVGHRDAGRRRRCRAARRRFIADEARDAMQARGGFTFAVSGGRTPWQMLRQLATRRRAVAKVQLFQVDERVAPAGDPDRNFTHITQTLLAARRCRPTHCTRCRSRLDDLEAAASDYAAALRAACGRRPCSTWCIWARRGRPHRFARAGRSRARVTEADVALTAPTGTPAHDAHLPGA